MNVFSPRLVVALLLSASLGAHAQFHRFTNGSISVGATGQFTKVLTEDPAAVTYPTPVGNEFVQVINQRQDTTWSTGFVTKVQFQPLPFAGLEFNYGFTRYSELYSYNSTGNTTTATAPGSLRVQTNWHEATSALLIHPKHIPFQPYVGVGGGYIDFDTQNNQWRGAGLLETGFDLPVRKTRMGFRIGARSLYYRAPNFNDSLLSTRSWRVTAEPEVSTYYRF